MRLKLKTIYKSEFKRKNESHAFVIAQQLLITGDSDKKTEKKWLSKNDLHRLRFLVAGHHGSRTSMAKELLHKMPSLEMVFASCKKKRYGHPHKETIEKIKRIQRPLLVTEIFGSMAVEVE
jgi:competence protein ComEC